MRQSYTNTWGDRQGQIDDLIAARDIARLEAALETLKKGRWGLKGFPTFYV
jgi:hypothetical protein